MEELDLVVVLDQGVGQFNKGARQEILPGHDIVTSFTFGTLPNRLNLRANQS
jgi:hypothetical protein